MITMANTVIVGAGQAGVTVSHYLTQLSHDHIVLEQADRPGDAWRNHRWDSFTPNTPNWPSRLLRHSPSILTSSTQVSRCRRRRLRRDDTFFEKRSLK